MNRFGFDFYRAMIESEEQKGANLVYSPYSISAAFSMVYAGACAKTEAQMAKVLGFLPQASHHRAAETFHSQLEAIADRPILDGEGNPYRSSYGTPSRFGARRATRSRRRTSGRWPGTTAPQ
ncbi:MAG: serpin family protein [Chloroflexia bacterium]